MDTRVNSFEALLKSFKQVCMNLEEHAGNNLRQIQNTCNNDIIISSGALRKFDQLISGLNEAFIEVLNGNGFLDFSVKENVEENTISLPCDIQSDTINCISDVYHMESLENYANRNKLVNDENEELVNKLINVCCKSVKNLKDSEFTILQAKEIL